MGKKKRVNPAALYFPQTIQDRLGYLKEYPLTIVHAPAGFGKTTALNHYFETDILPSTPVWRHTFLGRRAADTWQVICRMLAMVDSACAMELLQLGIPDEDNISAVAEALENLECRQETYLVLDSFELSGLPEPERFLALLSKHGGEALHIVAVTRELEGGVLLSNHRVYCLNAEHFLFRPEDIRAYFSLVGLEVSQEQEEAVYRTTGGWVLALYMQLMAYLQTGAFSGAGTAQLMQQVVWEGLTEEGRGLFLALSVFPSFTLAQAVKLSALTAEQTQGLLAAQSAFVQFDGDTHAFHLHTELAAFLRVKFSLLPPERQKHLYLLAGDCAAGIGDRHNTLRFYYLSGCWEKLFAMPQASYEFVYTVDETTKPMLLDVLGRTPVEIKRRYPAAMVSFAFALFFLNEIPKLMEIQAQVLELIRQSGLPQRRKEALQGEMELLLSFLDYNRIDAMSIRHRKALELLGGPASLISPKTTWTFGSPSVLFMYWRESGKLEEELAQMDECMPVYYRLSKGHGTGAEHIMRAEADFQRGNLDGAEILCHRTLLCADAAGQNSIYLCGLFLIAQIALFRGDETNLQATVSTIQTHSRQNSMNLCRYTKDLCLGYLDILLGNEQTVAPWLRQGDITPQRLVTMSQPFAYIIYGGCLLLQKEYHKLLGVSQQMLALSSVFPNLLSQVYARLYMARALDAIGKRGEALAELKTALEIALPDEVFMPFAENYRWIHGLLPGLPGARYGEALAKMRTLGEQFAASCERLGQKRPRLSQREQELYDLIRGGVTGNRALAECLSVSIPTVKTMLGRIYEKTRVSTKAQLILLDLR